MLRLWRLSVFQYERRCLRSSPYHRAGFPARPAKHAFEKRCLEHPVEGPSDRDEGPPKRSRTCAIMAVKLGVRILKFRLWEAATEVLFQRLSGIAKVDGADALRGRGNQYQSKKAWNNGKTDAHILSAVLVGGRFHAERWGCLFVEAAA